EEISVLQNLKTWELYFKELDKWIDHFTGFLDISLDETYQTPNGSRWIACLLCRSKNKHSYEILAEAIIVMAVWHPSEVNELFRQKGFTQVYLPLIGVDWKEINFPGKYYSGVLYYMMDSLFKVPLVLQKHA
ncbi:MAG: hypothetical protein NC906_07480, partial [Candidatus Omnitrophica bacterium]|nr:hypothetical protein [Candidatus Omnitrophota bacterium]